MVARCPESLKELDCSVMLLQPGCHVQESSSCNEFGSKDGEICQFRAALAGGTARSEMSCLEDDNCTWVEMWPLVTPCGCRSQTSTLKHEAKGGFSVSTREQDNSQTDK